MFWPPRYLEDFFLQITKAVLQNGKKNRKMVMLKVTLVYIMHFFSVCGEVNRNAIEPRLFAHFFAKLLLNIIFFH